MKLNPVPFDPKPENYLYPDRGMMKWMGFFLSEHTAFMGKQTKNNAPIYPKALMSDKEINHVLSDSWTYQHEISIQLKTLVNGEYLPDLTGIITGFSEDLVLIVDSDEQLNYLLIDDIRHIERIGEQRWFI